MKKTIRMSQDAYTMAQTLKAWHEAQACVIPEIKKHDLNPAGALGLLIQHAHGHLTGSDRMSEEDLLMAIKALLTSWKTGRFVPVSDYPYSLQETLDFARSLEANELELSGRND